MRKAIYILAAIAISLMAAGTAMATVTTSIHGFSSGVYDFSHSMNLDGNAWGSGEYLFTPSDMSADWVTSGADKFCIDVDQTLAFNKDPGAPSDPLFSMSLDAIGKHGDYATLSGSTDYDILQGAFMTGYASGDTKLLELQTFATNYDGWELYGQGIAKNDWAAFQADSGYVGGILGADFKAWY